MIINDNLWSAMVWEMVAESLRDWCETMINYDKIIYD